MQLRIAFLLYSSALAMFEAGAPAPDWSKPRQLPSPVVRWQRQGEPCALISRDGTAYVLEPGRLVALDAETGRARWEHPIQTEECPYHWQHPLLALDTVVVVAVNDTLFVVDRGSGARRHTLDLGGRFMTMWGPPVLVEAGEGEGRDLLAVDPVAGRVTGKHRFPAGIYGLQIADSVAFVTTKSPSLVALRLPGLQPSWDAEGVSSVGVFGGRPVVGRQAKDDCSCEDVFPVDPASGQFGARLFRGQPPDDQDRRPWDIEFADSEKGHSVRRLRSADGAALWQADIPGEVTAWRRADGRFYVHTSSTGRGFLVALDDATGALVSAAYGFRDVYSMEALGDSLVLLTSTGIVTVSSRAYGRPEALTVPVAQEVHKILAQPIEYWNQGDSLRDLEALGPEALPAIAAEVPALHGWPLAVAASRLGATGFKAAAPALAARVVSPDSAPHSESVATEVLDVVAALAGPGEVGPMKNVLEGPGHRESVRLHAFMVLTTIGGPEALDAADRALQRRRERVQRGFEPPSAASFVELIGRPVDEAARNRAVEREDFAEWARLGRGASSARVALPDARALVVFADERLGNAHDLWVQELGADGAVAGDSVLLGVLPPEPSCAGEDCRIEAAVQGTVVTVRHPGDARDSLRVELPDARRDSDGDGLTDFAEARLGTDAARTDSDGDGVDDAHDPFPRVARRDPANEVEEVTAAILEQSHLFSEEPSDLAVFVGDFAPPASGRQGPMLVVAPGELDAFKAKSGLDGASFITIGPVDTGGAHVAGEISALTRRGGPAEPPLDPRDRRYGLTVYRSPLNAAGYDVVVRRTDRGWRVRRVRQAWVS